MLWSDHGWPFGEKQRYGKTQLWQETCRVPFMVKVPGVTPDNADCKGIVNLIDMFPTLIELCISKNPDNDGRSFAQLLHDPTMDWNEPILTDYNYGGHRIYDGRYSYIVFEKCTGTEELYDHKVDPMEWSNLVRMPEYTQTLEQLKKYIPLVRQQEAPRN